MLVKRLANFEMKFIKIKGGYYRDCNGNVNLCIFTWGIEQIAIERMTFGRHINELSATVRIRNPQLKWT